MKVSCDECGAVKVSCDDGCGAVKVSCDGIVS